MLLVLFRQFSYPKVDDFSISVQKNQCWGCRESNLVKIGPFDGFQRELVTVKKLCQLTSTGREQGNNINSSTNAASSRNLAVKRRALDTRLAIYRHRDKQYLIG